MSVTPAQALLGFGFTALESEVYAFLLAHSPATGYRIAQGVGKPVANVYKAIESLERKGAAMVEQGENRQCRAVPSAELFARLSRDFELRRREAHNALQHVSVPAEDDRIYTLKSYDGALARVRTMLSEASRAAVVAAPAEGLESLRGALEACASRGVDVRVLGSRGPFEGVEAAGAEVAGLEAATDANQYLLVSAEEGIWTRHPIVARAGFEGLGARQALALLEERLEEGAGPKRLSRTLSSRLRV